MASQTRNKSCTETEISQHLQKSVEDRIREIMSCLVQQLLNIEGVTCVKLTGELGITINDMFYFTFVHNHKRQPNSNLMHSDTRLKFTTSTTTSSAAPILQSTIENDMDKMQDFYLHQIWPSQQLDALIKCQDTIKKTANSDRSTKELDVKMETTAEPDANGLIVCVSNKEDKKGIINVVMQSETRKNTDNNVKADHLSQHKRKRGRPHKKSCITEQKKLPVVDIQHDYTEQTGGNVASIDRGEINTDLEDTQKHKKSDSIDTAKQKTQRNKKTNNFLLGKKKTKKLIFLSKQKSASKWSDSSFSNTIPQNPPNSEVTLQNDKSTDISSNVVILECPICHKTYPTQKQRGFQRHVKQHSQRVQCETCGKWFSSIDSLNHHQRGLHKNIKPYTCQECGQTFSFHHSYKLHVQKHSGVRPYKCLHCPKTYLTSNHLKTHVASQHSSPNKQAHFQCEVCGRSFAWPSSLKTHCLIHSDVRPHKCSICSKGYTTKQALKLHSQSFHVEERKFQCDICQKFYKSEHLRDLHKRRHTTLKSRFMCDICGRQFMFKSSLDAHVNVHQDTRPFICKTCGKGFKLLTSLYTHQYTHTEDTPYKCHICAKAFKTKNCCTAHERRHIATKDFVCSTCSASFPEKGSLSKHMRTIHSPSRMFQCTICLKMGPRMDNMRTHMKSHARDVNFDILDNCIREVTEETGKNWSQVTTSRNHRSQAKIKQGEENSNQISSCVGCLQSVEKLEAYNKNAGLFSSDQTLIDPAKATLLNSQIDNPHLGHKLSESTIAPQKSALTPTTQASLSQAATLLHIHTSIQQVPPNYTTPLPMQPVPVEMQRISIHEVASPALTTLSQPMLPLTNYSPFPGTHVAGLGPPDSHVVLSQHLTMHSEQEHRLYTPDNY